MPVREVLFYEFDDFRLDVKRQELLKDGVPVSLTHKAFQILLILVQNFGQTVDKENIYQELWADSFVEDANLTQHIYILRKSLGRNPTGELYIETVARCGYQFTSEVNALYAPAIVPVPDAVLGQLYLPDEIHDSADHRETASKPYLTLLKNGDDQILHDGAPPENHISIPPDAPIPNSWRYRNVISAISLAAVIAAAVIGIFYYASRQQGKRLGNGKNKSVAVLPFKQIGEESRNEKLGLGMADAVITRLGKLREIPVRPTSAVFRYTDQPPENSSVAGLEMGVDTVLEGTVQRDDSRVRVSVRLMNVADGKTLWAENFDENFTNIFSVQDSISSKVVRALEINLTPQQENSITEHSTASTAAYQAFQLGVYFGNARTREGLEKAVSYFQKAIGDDPNYAGAYAMLADTYNMQAHYGLADPHEMRDRAAAATEKALSLDDKIPEAYIALAFLKLNEKDGLLPAKQSLERAIELAPFNATARVRYGWVLFMVREPVAAVEQMRRAQEYDPLSVVSNGALGEALEYQGNYAEAIKYCEKAIEVSPELINAEIRLAEVYFLGGRQSDALSLIQKTMSKADGKDKLDALGELGYFYAKLGNRKEAEKVIAQLRAHATDEPNFLNDLVFISYALGKRDDGFAYFTMLREKRSVARLQLYFNPVWADVRADERVMKIMGD